MFNIGEGFSYATVWQPEVDGKRVKANLTTSKKLKEENAEGKLFENSNWKAVFVGKAFEDACDLQEKDRIKIISGTVDNKPFTGADGVKKYFNNVTIFNFEKMASNEEIAGAAEPKAKAKPAPKNNKGTQFAALDDDDDSLPF